MTAQTILYFIYKMEQSELLQTMVSYMFNNDRTKKKMTINKK